MKVQINAGGREVTIECSDANVTPKDIGAEALALWAATGPDVPGNNTGGPAYGFSSERRNGQVQPLSPSSSFGLGWMHDPKATGER